MEQIEELIRQAVAFFEEGKIEQAEIAFRKILKQFPDHHLAIGCLGDFYIQVGRPDLALPFLRRLKAIKPDDYLSHFLLGVAYGKMARFFLANKELNEAHKLEPKNSEIIRQIGINLSLKGEIKEGRKFLNKAISLDPYSAEAYADLAASYMFNGEYEKAEEYIKKSLNLDPQYLTALQLLEDLKSNQQEIEKLSEIDKVKRLKELQSQEFRRQKQIELMMYNLSQMEAAAEDLAEIEIEFKEMGLSGQVTAVKDPNSPEGRAVTEYIERHKKIKNIDSQRLNPKEIKQNVRRLLDKKTCIEEQKDLILILAHQGSKEALDGLKKYAKNPHEELKFWAEMAVDECKSFLAGKILDKPVVQFRQIGEENKEINLIEKIKKFLKKGQ